MFFIKADRNGSKFEQTFQTWQEANEKSKLLASDGWTVQITRTRS